MGSLDCERLTAGERTERDQTKQREAVLAQRPNPRLSHASDR